MVTLGPPAGLHCSPPASGPAAGLLIPQERAQRAGRGPGRRSSVPLGTQLGDLGKVHAPLGGQISPPEGCVSRLEILFSTAPGYPRHNSMKCNPECVHGGSGPERSRTARWLAG